MHMSGPLLHQFNTFPYIYCGRDPSLVTAKARWNILGAFLFLLLGAFLFGVVLTQVNMDLAVGLIDLGHGLLSVF